MCSVNVEKTLTIVMIQLNLISGVINLFYKLCHFVLFYAKTLYEDHVINQEDN